MKQKIALLLAAALLLCSGVLARRAPRHVAPRAAELNFAFLTDVHVTPRGESDSLLRAAVAGGRFRTGHGRSLQHGQRRRTALRARHPQTFAQAVVRRARQPRDDVVGECLHDLRPPVRQRRPAGVPCGRLPLRRLHGGTLHEDGRRFGSARGSAMGRRADAGGASRRADRHVLPLSADERRDQPHGRHATAAPLRRAFRPVRPLPYAASLQLRLDSRADGTFAHPEEPHAGACGGLQPRAGVGRFGRPLREAAGRGAAALVRNPAGQFGGVGRAAVRSAACADHLRTDGCGARGRGRGVDLYGCRRRGRYDLLRHLAGSAESL